MKITSVVHEISMKISSIHRPKSERGRTVDMGWSQRLHPQEVARTPTASKRNAVRTLEGITRRLIMLADRASLSLEGGPLSRARFPLRDGCRDLGLREAEHGHPAAGGKQQNDDDGNARPEEIGAAPPTGADGRSPMTEHDQDGPRLQREEQRQYDGQQPMRDGVQGPSADLGHSEPRRLRDSSTGNR